MGQKSNFMALIQKSPQSISGLNRTKNYNKTDSNPCVRLYKCKIGTQMCGDHGPPGQTHTLFKDLIFRGNRKEAKGPNTMQRGLHGHMDVYPAEWVATGSRQLSP